MQSGVFFTVPLFLSVSLGLSAIDTGVRLLPLSVTLLIAAAGIPRFRPNANPRRVVRLALLAMFAGTVVLLAAIDEAGVSGETAAAILDENAEARLRALRTALAVIAIVAAAALFPAGAIPTRQPSATDAERGPPDRSHVPV